MSNYGFLLDEGERIEDFLAHLVSTAPPGWRPHRVIFRNFWFFHKEEFIWHHGRLFLGGQNAAGKSTVLSMVVPILLDGNKAEERLNTFGGHGRHMAYYVTGSPAQDDSSEAAYYHPVRTSYMALELCRTEPNGSLRYITFGQGLHHDRNSDDKTVRSWGFAVLDGRRIGRQTTGELFDVVRESGLSLSKADLKKLLGSGGEIYDTNLEYKKAVNRLVFGFRDLQDFDALVDLLLQIRRPKLTKEVRPRDVADILTQSLPVLDDAVMQVTAASLDHIDQAVQNIERINDQIVAANELEKATQAVFRRMAEVASAQYLQERKVADGLEQNLRAQEDALDKAQADLATATSTLTECGRRKADLEQERKSLESKDAFRAAEELVSINQQISAAEARLNGLRSVIRRIGEKARSLSSQRDQQIEEWQADREAALDLIGEALAQAETARWEAATAWAKTLQNTWEGLLPHRPHTDLPEAVPWYAASDGAAQRLALVGKVRLQLDARDAKRHSWQLAQGKEEETRGRLLAADHAFSLAVSAFESGRQDTAQAILSWAKEPRALRLPSEVVREIVDNMNRYQHGPDSQPRDLLRLGHHYVEEALSQALQAAAAATQGSEEATARANLLREQRQALDQAPPVPTRTPDQLHARRILTEAAIPYAPLYEALDLVDGIAPEAAATVEQSLASMGLLDALVVSAADQEHALTALRLHGLSERLLLSCPDQADTNSWAKLLVPDSEHPLAAEAERFLQGAPGAVQIDLDGTWQHGLLTGTAGTPSLARFIGRTARERNRLAESKRLDDEIATEVAAAGRAAAEAEKHTKVAEILRSDWNDLERLPELDKLVRLCLEVEQKRGQVETEQALLRQSQEATRLARSAWDAEEARLLELYVSFPAGQGLDHPGLSKLEQATRDVQTTFTRVFDAARALVKQQRAITQTGEQVASERAQQEEKEGQADELAVELRTLEGNVRGLQQLVDGAGAKSLFARLGVISAEIAQLQTEETKINREHAVAEQKANDIQAGLPSLRAEAEVARATLVNARARLNAAVLAYPTLQHHSETLTNDDGAPRVARTLLSRFEERPNLVTDIRDLEAADRGTLSKVFEENRPTLRHFYPDHLPSERSNRLVQFSVDGLPLTPHGLLQYLQEQATLLRNVLQHHEAELFERHLLQDVGREVRRCLLKAEDWVRDINNTLENHPLRNNEYVYLEWIPKGSDHELGSNIAKCIHLIRRDEASLTESQRDTLKGAFQEEIRQIREQAKRGDWRADVFREKLQEVLDYRTWFRFRIYVRGGVGGKQEITDTVYNARSGSERSLVLLFPLIAALSVRYDAASPDAPRLLALDEGFAGIDALNGRQMIRFLTSLQLTWVVTSEKPPALTEELAGASVYNMLRAGTVVATRPFFWDGHELLDEPWEVSGDGEA